jgi:hypothetical protein
MLSLATPQFSPFMLDVIVRPFYQLEQRPEIVRALQEESARWQR